MFLFITGQVLLPLHAAGPLIVRGQLQLLSRGWPLMTRDYKIFSWGCWDLVYPLPSTFWEWPFVTRDPIKLVSTKFCLTSISKLSSASDHLWLGTPKTHALRECWLWSEKWFAIDFIVESQSYSSLLFFKDVLRKLFVGVLCFISLD
jgi:hypothetical protein